MQFLVTAMAGFRAWVRGLLGDGQDDAAKYLLPTATGSQRIRLTVGQTHNEFAFALYGQLRDRTGNLFFSGFCRSRTQPHDEPFYLESGETMAPFMHHQQVRYLKADGFSESEYVASGCAAIRFCGCFSAKSEVVQACLR